MFEVFQNVNVRNRTVNMGAIKPLMPAGQYKFIIYADTSSGESIFTVNIVGDMNSPLKESFG